MTSPGIVLGALAVIVCGCAAIAGTPGVMFVRNCPNGVGYGGVISYTNRRRSTSARSRSARSDR
jgi:hypothetical protein